MGNGDFSGLPQQNYCYALSSQQRYQQDRRAVSGECYSPQNGSTYIVFDKEPQIVHIIPSDDNYQEDPAYFYGSDFDRRDFSRYQPIERYCDRNYPVNSEYMRKPDFDNRDFLRLTARPDFLNRPISSQLIPNAYAAATARYPQGQQATAVAAAQGNNSNVIVIAIIEGAKSGKVDLNQAHDFAIQMLQENKITKEEYIGTEKVLRQLAQQSVKQPHTASEAVKSPQQEESPVEAAVNAVNAGAISAQEAHKVLAKGVNDGTIKLNKDSAQLMGQIKAAAKAEEAEINPEQEEAKIEPAQKAAISRLQEVNGDIGFERDKNNPFELISKQNIAENGLKKFTKILPDGTTVEITKSENLKDKKLDGTNKEIIGGALIAGGVALTVLSGGIALPLIGALAAGGGIASFTSGAIDNNKARSAEPSYHATITSPNGTKEEFQAESLDEINVRIASRVNSENQFLK